MPPLRMDTIMALAHEHLLTISCPDRPGIVAAVSVNLAEQGGNILDAQQFDDVETSQFFMRVLFDCPKSSAELHESFAKIAENFKMTFTLRPRNHKKRVVILVSKFDHCL